MVAGGSKCYVNLKFRWLHDRDKCETYYKRSLQKPSSFLILEMGKKQFSPTQLALCWFWHFRIEPPTPSTLATGTPTATSLPATRAETAVPLALKSCSNLLGRSFSAKKYCNNQERHLPFDWEGSLYRLHIRCNLGFAFTFCRNIKHLKLKFMNDYNTKNCWIISL